MKEIATKVSKISKAQSDLVGQYIAALPPYSRNFCGPLCASVMEYFERGGEVSRRSWNRLKKEHTDYYKGSKKYDHINDFLAFAGLPARKRKQKTEEVEPLKKLETITKENEQHIAAYLEWLPSQYDYSKHTIDIHRTSMIKFFQYSTEFSHDACRRFLTTLAAQGIKPATINQRRYVLVTFGKFVKKPIELKGNKIQRVLHVENIPTVKEYETLLEYLQQHNKMLYWLVRIAATTGARMSELQQLTWGHIRQGEAYLNCKGRKWRYIFFPKQLVVDATKYADEKEYPDERLVSMSTMRTSDSPVTSRGIAESLRISANRCGYPKHKAHMHAFRHFFAKMYITKTKDVVQLANLMGHSSIDTTRIYMQKSKAEHIRDVNKFVSW